MGKWLHDNGKYLLAVILAMALMGAVFIFSSQINGVSPSGSTYASLGSGTSSTEPTSLHPTRLPVTARTISHGEDETIVWTDVGMEAYVRAWLDRPEGDILRSEVWDVRYLNISILNGEITALEEPADGEAFIFETDAQNQENWVYLSAGNMQIESLADLRYFDSLQYFSLTGNAAGGRKELDLDGIQSCVNLEYFSISYVSPVSLEAVSELQELVTFSATSCSQIDLSCLSVLEKLSIVEISQTDVESLEPLRGLALTELYMREDTAALNTDLGLEYSPLADLAELETLCLSGINDLSLEDLVYLQNLEYLNTLYLYDSGVKDSEAVSELLPQVQNIMM